MNRQTVALAMWAATAVVGCTTGIRNDIDSTNSELTGPYTVRRVTEGRTYVADICVANRSGNDLVASQIIDQRLSHGHDAIIVNLYHGQDGNAERVTWTPDKGSQASSIPGDATVCRQVS